MQKHPDSKMKILKDENSPVSVLNHTSSLILINLKRKNKGKKREYNAYHPSFKGEYFQDNKNIFNLKIINILSYRI